MIGDDGAPPAGDGGSDGDRVRETRPRTAFEIASDAAEMFRKRNPGFQGPDFFGEAVQELGTPPHCDPRILHRPEDCEYCARSVGLQEERERLRIRNTSVEGDQPNRVWPCPAELARSPESLRSWGGNLPIKDHDYAAQAMRSGRTDIGGVYESERCPVCGYPPEHCGCR